MCSKCLSTDTQIIYADKTIKCLDNDNTFTDGSTFCSKLSNTITGNTDAITCVECDETHSEWDGVNKCCAAGEY
jgi:hypothetical protein